MTAADLERLYLDGKISAKQYQRLLNEVKSRPAPAPAPATTPAQPPTIRPTVKPAPASPPVPRAVAVTNKDDKLNDFDSKLDELIRAKAQRDKATNTPPKTVTAAPKTKRERLDALLRLYIEGKITKPELDERRNKIIAEPD